MPEILGISGSLRAGSFNTMLLARLADAVPSGTTVSIASIRDVPLYDGDRESRDGLPDAVVALKEQLARADGLLLVTPEYNNGLPGVLKNVIDWMSRPASDIPRVFGGRAVAIAGATPGQGGTALAQAAWLPIIRTLGMRPWFQGRLLVSGAGRTFDANGAILDESVRNRVRTFIEGYAAFVSQR